MRVIIIIDLGAIDRSCEGPTSVCLGYYKDYLEGGSWSLEPWLRFRVGELLFWA